ncbi:unnamed protein product [Effrenium voratum]|uniref:Uncharacterized protein n=1 Tax=Effrenium voratum TaxID=2562239 RepID=A0AA36J1Z4_9DINO|nr:unnamed protein product [Effrenium voratum]
MMEMEDRSLSSTDAPDRSWRPREAQALQVPRGQGVSERTAHSFTCCERTPPVELTRVFGAYALPLAAPDMVGDREKVRSKSFDLGNLRVLENLTPTDRSDPTSEHQHWHSFFMSWRDWRRTWIGRGLEIALVLVYIAVEAAKILLSVKALHGETPTDGQVLVVFQGAVSLASGIFVTACLEGLAGLKLAFSPICTLRCLPVAAGFSLSQTALALALVEGLGAAVVMVTGYFYMPLCALLSALVFRRRYGWLEIHGLAFLTTSIMIFVELGNRVARVPNSFQAFEYNIVSIVLSCFASVYLEKILKPKYSERTSLNQHYYIQKVWLEIGGLVLSIPGLFAFQALSSKKQIFSGSWLEKIEAAFTGWMCAALAARVVQSWFTGLVSKYLSTLGRAVIQCVAVIVVHFWDTFFSSERWDLVTTMLALVVCLSAMMYQTGRRMTVVSWSSASGEAGGTAEEVSVVSTSGPSQQLTSPEGSFEIEGTASQPPSIKRRVDGSSLVPEAHLICEFEPAETEGRSCAPSQQQAQPGIGLLDRTWYDQAQHINNQLATWLASSVLCVVAFILSDACRTLINAWAIRDTPIVQQSVVWTMSASSIPIGILMSAVLDGREGVWASLLWRDSLTCFPVAACFSLGQTLQIKAYGAGISASVNTVLGYFYMPMSAMLSRWVFQRAYSALEWLALALLSLTAVVFCLLRSSRSSEDSASAVAIACCLGSVVSSCIGSLMCEKIMKARPYPFYTQKVHLEFGGLATASIMLFVVGSLSPHPADAFWKERDVDGQMEAGLFVGWSFKTFAALLGSVLQSWLGGLVSKRLSTVVRSVAQCLSLLIIYFFGDLVLKKLEFDWIVGAAAIIVALSVQVFTLAGQRRRAEAAEAG